MVGLGWWERRLWLIALLASAFVLDMAGQAAADVPPAAEVNTIASGPKGSTGIRVGKNSYPAKAGAWAQFVTLDRETLQPVKGQIVDLADKSYPCPDYSCAIGAARGD